MNDCVGQHLDIEAVCEKCLEFRLDWSALAAQASVQHAVALSLLDKAMKRYGVGDDAAASLLRELAREIQHKADDSSERLRKFIELSKAGKT